MIQRRLWSAMLLLAVVGFLRERTPVLAQEGTPLSPTAIAAATAPLDPVPTDAGPTPQLPQAPPMKWVPATHIAAVQNSAVPGAPPSAASATAPRKPLSPVFPVPDDGLPQPPSAAPAGQPANQGTPQPAGTLGGQPRSALKPMEPQPNHPPLPASPGSAPGAGTGPTALSGMPAGLQANTEADPRAAPAGPQVPTVAVETIGPASLNKSKMLSYVIVVRNPSTVPVFNVRVEDEPPAGARILRLAPPPDQQGRLLVWKLGTLAPGAERRLQVDAQPAGEGEVLSCATATFSVASCLRTRITQPRLTMAMTGPENVQVGDSAAFQIQVTNTGTGPATNVLLHDRLPAGLSHPQGDDIEADLFTLESGQTKSVTLQTTAVKSGRQVNEAFATADDDLKANALATVMVTEPVLALRKMGPQRRYVNRDADFELEVANVGTAPATGVRVVDTLPAGLEFVSTSDAGAYDPSARTVTWMVGALPAGQKRNLALKLSTRAVGDLINRAVAVADRGVQAKAQAQVHVEGIAALMLEVVDLDDPIEVGAETSYEIRVVNQGTGPSTGLQIIATVPLGMAPEGALGPTPYHIQGQQVIFDSMPKLAPKADALFRVRVRGLKPGDLRFKVQMTSDQLRLPVYEEESTRVYTD